MEKIQVRCGSGVGWFVKGNTETGNEIPTGMRLGVRAYHSFDLVFIFFLSMIGMADDCPGA